MRGRCSLLLIVLCLWAGEVTSFAVKRTSRQATRIRVRDRESRGKTSEIPINKHSDHDGYGSWNPLSLLELGTAMSWTGWAPKMQDSFDVETHAWKPPWFHDGVPATWVEPFPSNIWLKNGLAIPIMDADKYFFEDGDLQEPLSFAGADKKKKDNKQKGLEESVEDTSDAEEHDVPRVDGVPVPAAVKQFEQAKEYGVDTKKYIPGALVGQKLFNEWWKDLHTKEDSPASLKEKVDEVKSWWYPHTKEHWTDVFNNWGQYFNKLSDGMVDQAKERMEQSRKERIAASQNSDEAKERRSNFFFKPMPPGECFNIGSGVFCTPMLRDKPYVPAPLDTATTEAEHRISEMARKRERRCGLGLRTEAFAVTESQKLKDELQHRLTQMEPASS